MPPLKNETSVVKTCDGRLALTADSFILLLGLAALVCSSLVRLEQSLWIDELITAWVVRDGIKDVIERSIHFQGQSPLYYLFEWCSVSIFGPHEWALRLPTLAFNLATVRLIYTFSRQLTAREESLCATGAFALMVAFEQSLQEARPYALGLTCFTLSLYLLVRWALSGKRLDMASFVGAAVLTFYAHYLFAVGFALYVPVLFHLRNRLRISTRNALEAFWFWLLLCLPMAWQLHLLAGKAALYSYSTPPTVARWLWLVSRDQSILFLLAAAALSWHLTREPGQQPFQRYKSSLPLALGLWLYPSVIMVTLRLVSGVPLFLPRYLVYALIGESFVQSALLCSIRVAWQRVATFIGLLFFCLLHQATSPPFLQDWRGALAAIPSAVPSGSGVVLVQSGLCETKDLSWVKASDKRDYLLSSTSFYGSSHRTMPLPYNPGSIAAQDLFSTEELKSIKQAGRIFVVGPTFTLSSQGLENTDAPRRIPWIHPDITFEVMSVHKPNEMIVVELAPRG